MSQKEPKNPLDFQSLAEGAIVQGDWKTATELYAKCVDQRTAELALIHSVQQGLSAKLEMQAIYDLVGDKLRDTFNAQVVMISQYDPLIKKIFHHYAIEKGQHLHIQGWQPLDSSRGRIVRSGKPFMINGEQILKVLNSGAMKVVPGTNTPKTWLGVPMLVGDQVRGIVSLQNLDRENAFSRSDIDLLMTLITSMSQSLENARLFNQTELLLKRMEAEMLIARQTQRSILPSHAPRQPGYDFGSHITPAQAVGGDFYDFIHIDKNRYSLVIGDVSDKGLPAALFMALTFSLLRTETEHSDDPRQILLNVNRYLLKMNTSGMFVTLLYGVLDCTTGVFTYTRAGHLPPMLLDSRGRALKVSLEQGQALGLFKDVCLTRQQLVIPPGGLLLLSSDGLNEAVDLQGNEFGFDRVRQVLADGRNESARQICKRLWQAVVSHSESMSHQDDFTTLVVKRSA